MRWVSLLDQDALTLPQDFTARHREVILAFGELCVLLGRREQALLRREQASRGVSDPYAAIQMLRARTASARPGEATPEEISALAHWGARNYPVRLRAAHA